MIKTTKGKIIKIGYIDSNGFPRDFEFDCKNLTPALTIDNNELLLAGYTIKELKEIASIKWV